MCVLQLLWVMGIVRGMQLIGNTDNVGLQVKLGAYIHFTGKGCPTMGVSESDT